MDQLIVQLLQHLLHLFLFLLLLEKSTLFCFELGLDLGFVSVQSLLLLLDSVQFSLSLLVQSFLPFSLSGLFFLSHNFNFFAPSFQSLQQRVNVVLDMSVVPLHLRLHRRHSRAHLRRRGTRRLHLHQHSP